MLRCPLHQRLSNALPFMAHGPGTRPGQRGIVDQFALDRKSTRLNSSHLVISYAVFCLKKKKKNLSRASSCQDTTTASHELDGCVTSLISICHVCSSDT